MFVRWLTVLRIPRAVVAFSTEVRKFDLDVSIIVGTSFIVYVEKLKHSIMREKITRWFRNNNNHPLDNNSFYDIVIDSIENKIEQSTFENAIRDVNEDIAEDDINDIYMRYELLHSFILYYRRNH